MAGGRGGGSGVVYRQWREGPSVCSRDTPELMHCGPQSKGGGSGNWVQHRSSWDNRCYLTTANVSIEAIAAYSWLSVLANVSL